MPPPPPVEDYDDGVIEKKRKKKKKHRNRSPESPSERISNEDSEMVEASPKQLSDDQALSESELESKRLELLKALAED